MVDTERYTSGLRMAEHVFSKVLICSEISRSGEGKTSFLSQSVTFVENAIWQIYFGSMDTDLLWVSGVPPIHFV